MQFSVILEIGKKERGLKMGKLLESPWRETEKGQQKNGGKTDIGRGGHPSDTKHWGAREETR